MYATMDTKQSIGNQEKGLLTDSNKVMFQVDLECQGLQTLFYGIKKLMKVSEDKAMNWSFKNTYCNSDRQGVPIFFIRIQNKLEVKSLKAE